MYILRLKKTSNHSNLTFWLLIDKYTKAPASGSFFYKIGFFKPIVDIWNNKYVFADIDALIYLLKKGVKIHRSAFSLIKPLILYSLKHTYTII